MLSASEHENSMLKMNQVNLTYLQEELATVALGCILHDIGKPIQRADNNPFLKNHQRFGQEFILELAKTLSISLNTFSWKAVLDSIRYHHAKEGPNNADSYIAWIAYEADNLASAHDRSTAPFLYDEDKRLDECDVGSKTKDEWDNNRRLQSIFTYFSKFTQGRSSVKSVKDDDSFYDLWLKRDGEQGLDPYPYPTNKKNVENDTKLQYQKITKKIEKLCKSLIVRKSFDTNDLNQVSRHLEELFQFVPPDTYKEHTNDVSLYEHLKLTAAIGSCMFAYISEAFPDWIKLYTADTSFNSPWPKISSSGKDEKVYSRDTKAYILFKADISGIQDFIYNISSKQALKGLRGRSFYLELLCQQIADEILNIFHLGRVNQIYLGGGGFSLLLPNISAFKENIECLENNLNSWLLKLHDGKLSVSFGYTELSGNQMKINSSKSKTEEHPLNTAWKSISEMVGGKKLTKFQHNLDEIFTVSANDYEECKFCHKETDKLVSYMKDDLNVQVCNECESLINYGEWVSKAENFYLKFEKNNSGLFPEIHKNLSVTSLSLIKSKQKTENSFVIHDFDEEIAPKIYTSISIAKKNGSVCDFTDLAYLAKGVKRIGVLRADVDNLGKVFKSDSGFGFKGEYKSISRDTSLSRNLGRFFTLYLDDLLKDSDLNKSVTVVYAGGDDLFLVGAWDKVIDAAFRINTKLKEYTLGAINISAGISIHAPKFPLYRMAEAAGLAEKVAKSNDGKNSLSIFFDDGIFRKGFPSHTFHWNDWENILLQKKLLESFNLSSAYVYQILIYLRELINKGSSYSFPRLIYSTARMEELNTELKENKEWLKFRNSLFECFETQEECRIDLLKESLLKLRKLETALNYLLLLKRGNDDE
jgi:CRISPR-associated protein Csm1